MSLDPSKLVGVRRQFGKLTAMCPICAAQGRDLVSRNHLVVFDTGKYGCAVDRSDEHSQAIWQAVGLGSDGVVTEQRIPVIEPPPQIYPADCLERLIRDHSYWNARSISDATIAPFRGGVAATGSLADRYVFPIFSDNGDIIGFDARCLRRLSDEERKRFKRPKWKHLSPSSHFIWGSLDDIDDRIVLVESIGDSLMLREHGVPESLCLFGTNLSERLLGYIISRNPRQVVISTNRDSTRVYHGVESRPGQDAALRIAKALAPFFDEGVVSIVHPPEPLNDWGEDLDGRHIRATFLDAPVSLRETQQSESATIALDTEPNNATL